MIVTGVVLLRHLNLSPPSLSEFDDWVLNGWMESYFRNGALSELQQTVTIFLDSVQVVFDKPSERKGEYSIDH